MNKKEKTQRGITLIALVVTIIVILILSAVTITIMRNSGLIGYARQATEKTENKMDTEKDVMNIMVTGSCRHYKTEIRNKKEPACNEPGYTGSVYCVDCGRIVATGDEIKNLAHTDEDNDFICDVCSEDCYHEGTLVFKANNEAYLLGLAGVYAGPFVGWENGTIRLGGL